MGLFVALSMPVTYSISALPGVVTPVSSHPSTPGTSNVLHGRTNAWSALSSGKVLWMPPPATLPMVTTLLRGSSTM